MLIITFVNFQFSQLRDLCPLGMSIRGDGVRRASLETTLRTKVENLGSAKNVSLLHQTGVTEVYMWTN